MLPSRCSATPMRWKVLSLPHLAKRTVDNLLQPSPQQFCRPPLGRRLLLNLLNLHQPSQHLISLLLSLRMLPVEQQQLSPLLFQSTRMLQLQPRRG